MTVGPLTKALAIERYLSGDTDGDPAEGVWLWEDNAYEVAVVKNTTGRRTDYEYVAFVTSTRKEGWARGEAKFWLKRTAIEGMYFALYRDAKKQLFDTKMTLSDNVFRVVQPSHHNLTGSVRAFRTYPLPEHVESTIVTTQPPARSKPLAESRPLSVPDEAELQTMPSAVVTCVLVITTLPSGADVMLDERFLGQAPVRFPVTASDEHTVLISKSGYQDFVRVLNPISLGESPFHLVFRLEKEPAASD
jgi:hypothetical protein